MDARRLLTTVGAGMLVAAVAVAGTPAVAAAAPIAPKGLTVARATDVHKIQMTWKPVAGVDHYVVDIVAGDIQTVTEVPASATGYTIDAPDACTSYKMRVGAADSTGSTTSTGYTFVKSLAPSTVMGMVTDRPDAGTVASATWRLPAWTGYTPLTGYHVVLTRMADGVVLSDTTGPETTFRYVGADPARAYTLSVTSLNDYGACWTAKSLVDRFRPAEPTGLVTQRRADAPDTVELVWQAPSHGPTTTYYQLGYGQSKITTYVRVDPATTSHTLSLDPTKSWMIELKAYNANGGSNAVNGSVPAYEPAPGPTPAPTESAPAPSVSPTSTTTPDSPPADDPTTAAPTTTTPTETAPTTPTTTAPTETAPTTPTETAPTETAPTEAAPTGTAPTTTAPTTTAPTTVDTESDRTPPTVVATLSSTPPHGWFTSPVTIHFTCTDDRPEPVRCPSDILADTDGGSQRYSGTAVDAAGNSATGTVVIDMDRAAPTVTATIVGDANAAGWYTAAATVHFTCADAVSGVAECPADRQIDADGSGQPVSGTAVDAAGNAATTTVTVNLDHTAPAITATVLGDANADGWHRTPPTVHFTCADTGSGIASCPEDTVVVTDGLAQSVTGTAVDVAGNTATTSVAVSVDQAAPQITATVDGTKNAAGWYRGTPTVRFTCADTGSTVATCPAPVGVDGEGAGIWVPGTATDRAGNTSTTTVSVDIDRTAPTVAVSGATNGALYATDAVPSVSCLTTDRGSGVATEAKLTHTRTLSGMHTVVCAGATDKAGNAASPVTVSFTVRPTVAWISALTHQYLAGASATTLKELDALLAKRQFGAFTARIAAQAIGKKPALTLSEAVMLIYWTLLL